MFNRFQKQSADWLEERLHLSTFKKMMDKKMVPQHAHSIWYYLGGMALFFFLLQVLTGLLLMVYYQPGIDTSYESVKYIMEKVAFGKLIRSIHSWSANLMIGVVFIHMFSTYFLKAYRRPRELTWLTGMGLFALSLGLGFSGYLLAWDELAFFATKVGLQIMEQTPVVGPIMAELLRGGSDIGQATINRFFELHVIILPLSVAGLLGAHLLFVQLHGMSTPESYQNKPERHRKAIPFFSDFLYHDLLTWCVLLAFVVGLAAVMPWELGPKADPWGAAPVGIKPEWYFMFMFQILKMLPAHVGPIEGEVFGIMMFGLGGLLWALVPFWEPINKVTKKLAIWYGVFVVLVILIATMFGYNPGGNTPQPAAAVPAPAVALSPTDSNSAAAVFQQSCAGCHSIGGGKRMGPDLKNVTQNRDRDQLANFIVAPSGSAMPQIPGMDKQTAMALLSYIDEESNPAKADAPSNKPEPQKKPLTNKDAHTGQALFLGSKPFKNAGTACIACHSVSGIGAYGGGTLGPNLTGTYKQFGGRDGLESWLANIPSPTMKPLYEKHPLTPEEISALTAYLASVSEQDELKTVPRENQNSFYVIGVIGMVVLMVILGLFYKRRPPKGKGKPSAG